MCVWGVPAAATHQAQGRPVCGGGLRAGRRARRHLTRAQGAGDSGDTMCPPQAGNVTERFTESFSGLPPRYLFL